VEKATELGANFMETEASYKKVPVGPNLTKLQRMKVYLKMSQYKKLFEFKMGSSTAVEHKIHTKGEPVKQKAYWVSPTQRGDIDKEITKMLKAGVIRKSKSPYASPVVLVRKPDGSWRFCVNYRRFNKMSLSDNYPVVGIQQKLSGLNGAKFFIKIDLAAGYWQIPLRKEDIAKTAFIANGQLYEFTVMPFGLKTAPATFQRMMDDVLEGLIEDSVLVYLDDILIYGSTFEEIMERFNQVFNRLDNANLQIRAKKCMVGLAEIEYLGYMVTERGIFKKMEKIKPIEQFPAPKTQRKLRRFLGMAGFYRNFIPNFSSIVGPLNGLQSKKKKYVWETIHEEAFTKLKEALCSDDPEFGVLAHPDYSQPFTIFTDACDYGVGAVLMQNGRPIWYASRALNPLEVKYDTREKEAIAIMYGLEKFKPYFYPNHVKVMTDHGNLRWLMHHQQTGRLARWQLMLQQYDFEICFVKGEHNPVADFLSRDLVIESRIQLNAMSLRHRGKVDYKESADGLKMDVDTTPKAIPPSTLKFNWAAEQGKDPNLLRQIEKKTKWFKMENEIIYRTTEEGKQRICVPEHLIDEVIIKVHESPEVAHGGRGQVGYHLRGFWFSGASSRIGKNLKCCLECVKVKGIGNNNEFHSRKPCQILDKF